MQIDLTIKNYRSFADSKPAQLSIRPGFTAFLGANNAGKSSLLRFFYEFRRLFQVLSSPDGNLSMALRLVPQGFDKPNSAMDVQELFSDSNRRDLEMTLRVKASGSVGEVRSAESLILTFSRANAQWTARTDSTARLSDLSQLNWGGNILRNSNQNLEDMSEVFRAFSILANTVYIGSFRNAINIGAVGNYFDIAVGQAFIQAWRNYKEGPVRKNRQAAIQITEDIRNIFGYKKLEINPSEDNLTLVLNINDRSYNLYEVGSGLAQFVIVLINAAIKSPAYILIDEPELSLHASLQLRFLTALGSLASEGVVFATHSYGLARAGAEYVYTVMKDSDEASSVRELETTPRLPELLGELGFSSYRELGFEKVLLVEGIKDIKTVQQFLRYFGKDHQVVLLPMGGGQFIRGDVAVELQEIKRISNNVSALIDSERTSEGCPLSAEREAFVETCNKLKIRCCVLKRRAIENYLSDRAVKQVKGDKYRGLTPYECLTDVSPAWGKSEDWRIAREMTPQELDETDLGAFLKSL